MPLAFLLSIYDEFPLAFTFSSLFSFLFLVSVLGTLAFFSLFFFFVFLVFVFSFSSPLGLSRGVLHLFKALFSFFWRFSKVWAAVNDYESFLVTRRNVGNGRGIDAAGSALLVTGRGNWRLCDMWQMIGHLFHVIEQVSAYLPRVRCTGITKPRFAGLGRHGES